ncbi:MAG: 30S ribosome-binding factor RbfA [Candidatus Zixiibacteriota bacterium]
MKPADRHQRVAEEIQRVVAEVLNREIKDYDLSMVTVTRCDLARDYSEATIRYSVLGDEPARTTCAAHLAKIAGFVQKRVAGEIKLYRVPRLRFEFDPSLDDSMKLEQLFNRIARERRDDQQ